jgi:hypothetical protein
MARPRSIALTISLLVLGALVTGTQASAQSGPPTDIATGAATPSDTSAEVLGYFNYGATYPPSIAKDCWFEYGTTTAYGSRASAICGGTSKATLSPLTPATTYHYRAAASNDGGTTYGPDKVFTTLGSPSGGGPPTDTPRTTVSFVSGQSIASVRRRGLRLRVTLGGPCPCSLRGKLVVSRTTAKNLGLEHSRTIAATRRSFDSADTVSVTLEPRSALKRKLRRLHALKVTARATVSGASGEAQVVERSLRLRRGR